ncbi:MAG: hypothetical protein GY906_06155 [bacterium]|nr:hypothetical protein [bacterium]
MRLVARLFTSDPGSGRLGAVQKRHILILLGLALVVRLLLLGWDSGLLSPHPDERQVVFVAEPMTGWLSDPGFFAYGTLHIQLVRASAWVSEHSVDYAALLRGGRKLSVLVSFAAILLGWWVARRAWGGRTAAVFVMLAFLIPLDLQQSHFATVEAHHALWVIATIAATWLVATRPSVGSALIVGAAFGASLAVKVASLPLLLPLAAAWVVAGCSGRLRAVGLAGLSLVTAIAALWLGQPWTFTDAEPPLAALLTLTIASVLVLRAASHKSLRRWLLVASCLLVVFAIVWTARSPQLLNPEYLRGVSAQIDMVSGRADLPYVRVYRSTLPILYSLRELGLWGLGPALLAAAVLSTGLALARLRKHWRRVLSIAPSPGLTLVLLLLIWIVPMALRLSTLQVKFLRYWQPLVIPMALVVAWGVTRMPRRWRRRSVSAVVLLTLVWGIGFLLGFSQPHPHATASKWLDRVVEPNQTVAFEHWDEGLTLWPAGEVVQRTELPSYDLPDDPDKVRKWCDALSSADWVVLTSNRVRRTVLENANRFPRTSHLYVLLLGGQLGFEPVTRIERGPHFLGLRWPVQRADESFVNYDFPRVVVLRKTENLSTSGLLERLRAAPKNTEPTSSAALDRKSVAPLSQVEAAPHLQRQGLVSILWLGVIAFSGVAAWVIFLPYLSRWPDAGVGLCLVTGWIVPPWLVWIGSQTRLLAIGAESLTLVWLVWIAIGAWFLWLRSKAISCAYRARKRGILTVGAVVVSVWLLFLMIRTTNPAIFWGEKPMDFSFFNAFLRAEAWPPGEPWMAGAKLHYYYFGEVLVAFWTLLVGASAGVGYNLASATLPALSASAVASLALVLARGRMLAAILAPVLVILSGNLAWPWLLDLAKDRRWFDMWWATSRVVPGFAIDEYPLWTALFADLHAHFIAFPVLIAGFAWALATAQAPVGRWYTAVLMTGLSAAVLAATNPWDLPIFVAALTVATLFSGRVVTTFGRLSVAAGLSLVLALPFPFELWDWFGSGVGGGRLIGPHDGEQAPAWAVLRHFGLFWLPLAAMALVRICGELSPDWRIVRHARSIRDLLARLALYRLVGLVGGYSLVMCAAMLPGWLHSSGAAMVALPAVVVFGAAALFADRLQERLAWAIASVASLMVALCEWVTLIDRMNTLFKVYNGVWLLLAVSLAVLLMLARKKTVRWIGFAVWAPLQVIALLNLPLGVLQGWSQPKVRSPRPTLDGDAYLEASDPHTFVLAGAIQAMAVPGDVVAEAAGSSYREYTRIAMHTGQPSVVGWEWHLQQRGQDPIEIAARCDDLEKLYTESNPLAQVEILERYGVDWIVMGDVERETYGIEVADPFADVVSVRRVFEREGAALFRVQRSSAHSRRDAR